MTAFCLCPHCCETGPPVLPWFLLLTTPPFQLTLLSSISSHWRDNVTTQLLAPRGSRLGRAWRTAKTSPILSIFSGKAWVCGFLRPSHNGSDLRLPYVGPAILRREPPYSHLGLGRFLLPDKSLLGHQTESYWADNFQEARSIFWPLNTWEYAVRSPFTWVNELIQEMKNIFFPSLKIGERESPELCNFMISYTLCHQPPREARKAVRREEPKSRLNENSWTGPGNEKKKKIICCHYRFLFALNPGAQSVSCV